MPSMMLRLAVALITFGLGVSATMFWIAYPPLPPVEVIHFDRQVNPCEVPVPPLPPLGRLIDELPPPPVGPIAATISGGVLNSRAISKPAPVYPAIAGVARAAGVIAVRVVVDETGNVIFAKAISGHPLLRQAATQAAYQARLAPALLGGEPIKVTGTLTYDFVLQ
ncbi:MAG: TonB family protein [Pyrinomonadaceae bacterium]